MWSLCSTVPDVADKASTVKRKTRDRMHANMKTTDHAPTMNRTDLCCSGPTLSAIVLMDRGRESDKVGDGARREVEVKVRE